MQQMLRLYTYVIMITLLLLLAITSRQDFSELSKVSQFGARPCSSLSKMW